MKLNWMGEYRNLIEQLIRYGNSYAHIYNRPVKITETISLSPSEIQVLEYILENEEKKQKMAELAQRLAISPSSFTKIVNKLAKLNLLEKYRKGNNRKDIIISQLSHMNNVQ